MLSMKEKFGSAGFDWDPEKSGYTPVGLDFPGMPSDPNSEEFKRRETIEEFQRGVLLGFTMAELTQMDVVPVREMKPSTLYNGIVKLLQPPQWEKTPSKKFSRTNLYPIGNGKGNWTIHNPVLFSAMAPVLKMASRMLQSTDLLPWFDAVLNGDRRPIEDWRKPASIVGSNMWGLQSFHRRPAHEMQNVAKDRNDVFEEMMTTYACEFGFMQKYEDPRTADPNSSGVHGVTYGTELTGIAGDVPQFFVKISIDDVEPLLASINEAERMCIEWFIAETLVHEIMHLVYCKWAWHHSPIGEMYFEEEQLMENGCSFANACFGGLIHPINHRGGHSLGSYLKTPWPTQENKKDCIATDPILQPVLDEIHSFWPLPLPLIEDAHQDDFWELVARKYGHKLLRMRYLKYGLRFDDDGDYENVVYGPFEKERKGFEDDVMGKGKGKGIGELCAMLPDEVRQVKFAREMFESSEREQRFWDGSLAQVEEFQRMTTKANPGSTLRQKLLSKVKEAVSHHLNTVKALNDIERYSAHASTEARRQNLLDWNRGTRIFLNGFSGNAFDLKQTCLELEKSRLGLWCPNQPDPPPNTDRRELTLLQFALPLLHSQSPTILQISDQILQSPSVTLFGRACAEILLAAAYWDSARETDEERTRYVEERAGLLGQLKFHGMARALETGWEGVIDEWLRVVLGLKGRVRGGS